MLTTGTLLRLIVWMIAAKSLLIGGSKPTPKMASTTRLYESATSCASDGRYNSDGMSAFSHCVARLAHSACPADGLGKNTVGL